MFKTSNFVYRYKKVCSGIEFKVKKIMSLNNESTPRPRGLGLNSKAPPINTIDIYGNPINLSNLLREYNGILIDFFRGTW